MLPLGKLGRVMAGQPPPPLITTVYDLLPGQPPKPVAVIVKVEVPFALGVPLTAPVAKFKLSPGGGAPEVTA